MKKFIESDLSLTTTEKNKILVVPDAASPVNETHLVKEPGSEITVGYVGQLHAGKGVEMILSLAKFHPDKKFHIVGGTTAEISTLKIEDIENVIFHGQLPYNEAEQVRLKCDVLLAPYQKRVATFGNAKNDIAAWMSPLKLFEYMAARKAIICSNLPVLREIMEHDRNCLLVEHDDPIQWNLALQKLENNELRDKLSKEAYADFINKYTWDSLSKHVLQ